MARGTDKGEGVRHGKINHLVSSFAMEFWGSSRTGYYHGISALVAAFDDDTPMGYDDDQKTPLGMQDDTVPP